MAITAGNSLLDQALGGASELVLHRGPRPLAGIEYRQPQRPVVVQDRAQVVPADALSASDGVLEHQVAILVVLGEDPVTHKMENMILVAAELLLERGEGGRFEPLQVHQAA